ncbi:hypothetical protein ACQ4M3_01005 [Leptolyngbya sp. AN03gr2]|uniref:hypothetical protein n=1 Tax=unclassified Leptolyngbya TaxID=2650499 RepID=UPI003D31FF58
MAILLSEELKETIYVTFLTVPLPTAVITVDAQDLVDPEFHQSWESKGGKSKYSLEISERITQMIEVFRNRRTEILQSLLFDGAKYLVFQSQLEQFLLQCDQLKHDLADEIDCILDDYDEIRDDFATRLWEEICTARKKHLREEGTDVEAKANELVEFYMSRKFPTEEKIKKKCRVVVEPPRLFKQATPPGLSREAQAAYEATQRDNVKRIRDLLAENYADLESRAAIGFIEAFQQLSAVGALTVRFLDEELAFAIAHPNGLELPDSEEDDCDLQGLTLEDDCEDHADRTDPQPPANVTQIRITAHAENLKDKRYGVNSYQLLARESDTLITNLTASLPELSEVLEREDLEEIHTMINNLQVFKKMAEQWIDDYNTAKAGKKARSRRKVVESMTVEVDEAPQTSAEDVIEITIDNQLPDWVELAVEPSQPNPEREEMIELTLDSNNLLI